MFSQQWPTGVLPKSSFVGELAALRIYLSQRVHAARTGVELTTPPRLLLWVTDNQGAALTIDSGTSHEADGCELLHEIFEMAGNLHITLVAL